MCSAWGGRKRVEVGDGEGVAQADGAGAAEGDVAPQARAAVGDGDDPVPLLEELRGHDHMARVWSPPCLPVGLIFRSGPGT